jgi:hypothetical protein
MRIFLVLSLVFICVHALGASSEGEKRAYESACKQPVEEYLVSRVSPDVGCFLIRVDLEEREYLPLSRSEDTEREFHFDRSGSVFKAILECERSERALFVALTEVNRTSHNLNCKVIDSVRRW